MALNLSSEPCHTAGSACLLRTVHSLMRISSCSEFRRNLAAAIDRVHADREPLIITRDRGKPMAVLMSLEDFASYEETRHLLRSAKTAERLMEAIGELERGGGTERTVAEWGSSSASAPGRTPSIGRRTMPNCSRA